MLVLENKMRPNPGGIGRKEKQTLKANRSLPPAQKIGNPKPTYLAPVFENIEKAFADHNNFVLWRAKQDPKSGKWTKPPIQANGRSASSTNDATHTDLQSAIIACLVDRVGVAVDGLGYVFMQGGNTCGIDLDHVIDSNGEIETWAGEVLEKFKGTYIEKSVSGDGFHIFCKGVAPHCGKAGPANRLEMYDKARYFTLTGHLAGDVASLTDQQAAIDWLHAAYFIEKGKDKAEAKTSAPAAANAPQNESFGTDEEILQICNSKTEFVKLYQGDYEGYPSQSEADQALCNKLSYYTIDAEQINRLFQGSGLMRDKWDRDDYRENTIAKAINSDAARHGIEARTVHLPLSVNLPIAEPHKIYHPAQINWKKEKSGERTFSSAKGTAKNLKCLLNAYSVKLRYNEMTKGVEVTGQGDAIKGDLAASVSLSMVQDLAEINSYPVKKVEGHIDTVAHSDTYHPAADWVRSRPWDGTSRIDELFATLELAEPTQKQTSYLLFRKWLIGAVSILTGKTTIFEHVLVFVDPLGGIGKTRWFAALCPSDFRATGISLDVNNKDSVLIAVSKWLVELGEIGSTFKKSDMEALKAFLSKSEDELRPAYGRTRNKYQRRTAFFGTVNDIKFLTDSTNNRRFWPIEVSNVNYLHTIDMQQLWAECEHLAEQGEIHYLTPQENEMMAIHNEDFKTVDPIEELIRARYDFDNLAHTRRMATTEIAREIGYPQPTRAQVSTIGKTLNALKIRKTASKGLSRYYMPPFKHGISDDAPSQSDDTFED